ncbi:GDSL-type esterase/lipase family protein [uncultured Pseudoteredinibacter sp.]|uniref:GDSL-type esterase/lipase family protein n=1 Tax=uncultured Pseudoteredinibacter sp. TaxID=1641701 RepID=UPI00261E38CF|nr:GDSL-type esterase/lipase family protein [uncultured Pseudoteredinibacter sp.]
MNNANKASSTRRVLVYGDSNTWGWIGVEHAFPSTRYPDEQRWAGVMANILGDDFQVSVDGLTSRTTNLDDAGQWNTVAGQMLNGERLLPQAIAREMPLDLIVIALGTNDLKAEYQREAKDVAAAIVNLAALAGASDYGIAYEYLAPKVLIVSPAVIGDISHEGFRAAFAGAAEKSRALAAEIKQQASSQHIPVVDSSEVIEVSGAIDGIHLSLRQHQLLGEHIAAQVKKILS